MSYEPIDHIKLAESRLATQYKESVNLIAYIKKLLYESDTLEQVFADIISKRYLENAIGVQQDIVGALVGQPRILIDASMLSYFGFEGDANSQSFGDINNNTIGGGFRSVDESTTGNRSLTDNEYRLYIKARIIKNSISPTSQSLSDFIRFLFDVDQVIIVDGKMNYSVQISRLLDTNEKAFLANTDLVPKVAAVGVTYIEYDGDDSFTFTGVPIGKGFGDINNVETGGKFSSLIN